MKEEILLNVTPSETRVAVVENGVLQELHVERTSNKGIVGNIYRGKVVRVLPGMQAAFVDIGLEKAAFLHAQDILDGAGEPVDQDVNIRSLVHEGQEIVVEVLKEPLGTKGARVTTQLSISSRYIVFSPCNEHVGVSLRIEDEQERERLRMTVEALRAELRDVLPGAPKRLGFIVRTASEGIDQETLKADMEFTVKLWMGVEERRLQVSVPGKMYGDLPLFMRTVRDLWRPNLERVRVDSRETFQMLSDFVARMVPLMQDKLEYYPGERPIFELYNVEQEIQRALERRVDLKSGGYLIIDQTEAMTTIDVNTGAFVGHRNLHETIFKTNLEAATALARQIRLRNLGGIIIIDFIDMRDAEHQRQVLRTLEKALEKDVAKVVVSGFSELGLIQMTRKRTRESLEHTLCEPCLACQGSGSVKTAQTVCYEIFREILREERAYASANYLVLAAQGVIDRLLDEESPHVADLEEFIGKTIRFQVEPLYGQEQFDIVLM
jgi:ribonuclease G